MTATPITTEEFRTAPEKCEDCPPPEYGDATRCLTCPGRTNPMSEEDYQRHIGQLFTARHPYVAKCGRNGEWYVDGPRFFLRGYRNQAEAELRADDLNNAYMLGLARGEERRARRAIRMDDRNEQEMSRE